MTELEKLKHLLAHWSDHNEGHVRAYDEWARKAEKLGEKELSGILDQITWESRRIGDLFQKALDTL
jgi:hypothetical protein